MATTELNPEYVPSDPSSYSYPQPLELEKTRVALTPSTPNALLVEEDLQTSVVNALTLEGGALSESREDDRKDPSTGEHEADDSHSPPSPRERPERSPVTDGRDSDPRLDAPIDRPDPPTPLRHSVPKADEGLPPPAENGDQGVATMTSQLPEHRATPPPNRVGDPFSLSGLPTLQTFIPDDLFPDDLLVHDPDHIIIKRSRDKSESPSDLPVRYVRIFPNLKASREPFLRYPQLCPDLKAAHQRFMPPEPAFLNRSPTDPVRVAHLYLKADNRLGTGHHSSVFSAPLRLRLNPQSGEESTVRVAAKTAHGPCGTHKMLHLEAGVYDAFPRHFMDDQYVAGTLGSATAFQPDEVARPGFAPQADAATAASGGFSTGSAGDQRTVAARWIEPAVVPKFYGYYAAVASDGSVITPLHVRCLPDATCAVPWPTRILLVEECGRPIFPPVFTQEQKLRCLQLVERLHAAGFTQNSMHVRNILVQPGPLAAPPAARSYATPSFRIIDFGRGMVLSYLPPQLQWVFAMICKGEEWRATRVLELCRSSECARSEPLPVDTILYMLYEGLMSMH
ncbi:hypothetical protein LXA43DRAFT_1004508 [Ganoderma leucocontextum]|nr:hypothetical protein LXA43DRAFT_1004508 [Ganoderma leucocontextum]